MKNASLSFGFLLVAMFTLGILCTSSCTSPKETTIKKKKDISTGDGKSIISAQLISKHFVKKNGEITDRKELYIRRSIQDYFIKFCESEITREALEHHLSSIQGAIKIVTLEVAFREGNWDICDENVPQQSRIGRYVIVHRIISD